VNRIRHVKKILRKYKKLRRYHDFCFAVLFKLVEDTGEVVVSNEPC